MQREAALQEGPNAVTRILTISLSDPQGHKTQFIGHKATKQQARAMQGAKSIFNTEVGASFPRAYK